MRLKDHYATMPLMDSLVAVSVGDDAAFKGAIKMNRTAAAIFDMLKTDTTESAIIEALAQRFVAPRDLIADDVRRYLDMFREKGLLIE